MNVLKQNWVQRVVVIMSLTLLVSVAIYPLEFSNWAESIRQALSAQESGEPRAERSYIGVVLGSLLKAFVLMGVPIGLTLILNKLRLRFLAKRSTPVNS